jgi:hypothetical protein
MDSQTVFIEKRSARAVEVCKGKLIRITEIEGPQLAVLIAFNKDDLSERFSPGNTRVSLGVGPFKKPTSDGAMPYWIEKGDTLVSTRWNPMLSLMEDTYGRHDIVFDPCDSRFNVNIMGMEKGYPGCRELHAEALKAWALKPDDIPSGANLFQNTIYSEKGMSVLPTNAKMNDMVIFKAHMDMIVSLTSCPFSLGESKSIRLEIFSA